jgi:hypothetical protein
MLRLARTAAPGPDESSEVGRGGAADDGARGDGGEERGV